MRKTFLALVLLSLFGAQTASAGPVVMIAVDGMSPGLLDAAKARGVSIPNLLAFRAGSAYAEEVRNALPTLTGPNMATLVTGVWPRDHGIQNNSAFDPYEKNQIGFHVYAMDIEVPTIWDAAHDGGKKVASLFWPTSAGARGIDYNIAPMIWAPSAHDLKLSKLVSTPGLVDELAATTGISFATVMSSGLPDGGTPEEDLARAQYMKALYAAKKPDLATFYFGSLDHTEHYKGADSKEADAVLAKLDTIIGDVIASVRKVHPGVTIAIVSDHGFQNVTRMLALSRIFMEAGLITVDPKTKKATRWEAIPRNSGGSFSIILARPDDKALKAKVAALLKKTAADPKMGIARIAGEKEIARLGGAKGASFWVNLQPDTMGTNRYDAPLVGPPVPGVIGMHSYMPETPLMGSAFMISGPAVPKTGSLGRIEMIDIAPTLAKIVGVPMPSAKGKPLF